MKTFASSFRSVQNLAATSNETQEAFSMIAYGTQLCIQWSQSITNRVVKAFKAIYDFIVYVGCEIGKHNYTIQVYVYDRLWRLYEATRDRVKSLATDYRTNMLFKGIMYFLYAWLIFFIVHLIIVFLRERYQLQGCVLCLDQEVDKITDYVQVQKDRFVQSQIRDGFEPEN